MGHTCPNCGYMCHCSGDIDDIDFGEWSDCRCDCQDEDDWDDGDWGPYVDDENDEEDEIHELYYPTTDDIMPDDELAQKLKLVYEDLQQDWEHFNMAHGTVTMLINQGHNAESIACYLQLHCGFYAFVPDTIESLLKHGIVKE